MEEARTSEELNEDSEDTQGEIQEQPDTDQDSFTTVSRDSLPPELQERWDSMNRDYTQKTQSLASMRREIQEQSDLVRVGELVASNPILNEAVRKIVAGEDISITSGNQPAGSVQTNTREELPDPGSDPEGYLSAIVGRELDKRLGPAIQNSMEPVVKNVGSVQDYILENQRNVEFEAVASKFPAAKVVGQDRLDLVRAKYSKAGNPISYEEALGVIAVNEDPNVLQRPQQVRTTGTKPKPTVQRSQPPEPFTPMAGDLSSLQNRVRELRDKKDTGMDNAINRALDKIRSRRGSRGER